MPNNLRFFWQHRWKVFEAIVAVMLAVLVSANAMTATAAPAGQAGSNAVDVTVQDANGPLANRLVYLYDGAGATYLGMSATTDVNGVASFSLANGVYTFRSDDVNGRQYFSAACDTATPCTATTITEPLFSQVSVTVQDPGGPLANRTVYAFDTTSPNPVYQGLSAVTGAAGEVAVFNLPVGAYSFASDDVNGRRYFSAACDTAAATPCTAAAIDEPAFGSVTVTVQDANGPLTGRTVYVFDTAATPVYQGLSAVTDGAGQATFNLPIAAYSFASDDVNNHRYFSAACDMTASCAATTITEPIFGDVAVTVNDGVNPIAGQTVYAFDYGTGTPPYAYQGLSGVTDANGVFTFTLPANTNGYIFGTDDVNNVRHFSSGACDITTSCTAATITMPVYADVGVLVTDGTNGIANQLVYVFDAVSNGYLNLSGTTDATGVVTFTLPSSASGYIFGTDDVNNVRHFSTTACVVTGCTSAQITMPVYGDIAVNVSNANGSLASRVVYVFDYGTGTQPYAYQNISGLTDASGTVTFTLPANGTGYIFGTDDVNQVRRYSTPAPCAVGTCTNAGIVEPLFGAVQVSVVTANGPLAGQTVYVYDGARTGYQNLSAVTGPNGEPAVFNLPEGGYSFRSDANSVQYWSTPAVCTVLGCNNATIMMPLGGAGAVTVDLCATSGSMDLPGVSALPIYGYKLGDCTDTAPVQLPGPTLNFIAGDAVTVRLHNSLADTTALLFQGQNMIPDLTGVTAGGAKEYTFTAKEGTYLYEAGLLDNGAHQIAMGLYGAMVVRPAGTLNQAYSSPAVNYDNEAVVVLSEIDPALNASATPSSFDMRDWVPTFRLVNGTVSPLTDVFSALPGQSLLLRYVNAGLQPHSMSVLGLRQSEVAMDGNAYAHAKHFVADTLAPGQTADMLVTIPATTAIGSKFALYDGSFTLNNNGSGMGGMLTFVEAGVAAVNPNDVTGPRVGAVALQPAVTNGSGDVQIAASISDVASGNSNILAAEYFIDTIGANGNGIAMSGTYGAPTESVAGTLSAAQLAGLTSGKHTIYVHGQDAAGIWGDTNFAVLNLDKQGPLASSLVLSPNPSNGSVQVTVSATADDQTTGNNTIVGAEYRIGGGNAQPMNVNVPAPVASLVAVIPVIDLAGLTDGAHSIEVRAMDSLGNWGNWTSTSLLIDTSAPEALSVTISPDVPNNGTVPVNSSQLAIRVDATLTDIGTVLATIEPTAPVVQPPVASASHLYLPAVTNNGGSANLGVTTAAVTPNTSYVKRAEGFIGTQGANGTGFPLMATDSVFDQGTENAYAFIPLSTIAQLPDGPIDICVHAQDGAGNWGGFACATLAVDKLPPVVSNLAASNNPTNSGASNNVSFVLSATATDVAGVARAEWFTGADPGAGSATPMTISGTGPWGLSATIDFMALGWQSGLRTIYVRAQDKLGNAWSQPQPIVVDIQLPNLIFADGFESGNFSAWSSVTNNNNSFRVSQNAASEGSYKMQVSTTNSTERYVTDLTPTAETGYHARFYFNPNGTSGTNVTRQIMRGMNGNTTVFTVSVRRQCATPNCTQGNSWQVGATVSRVGGGGSSSTNWFTIPSSGYTSIEIAWESGAAASFSIATNGVVRQTLTGMNTSQYTLETVQIGPFGSTLGSTWYFDNFTSARRILP